MASRDAVDARFAWPTAVEMHFMFYSPSRIPMSVLEQLNKAWVNRKGRSPATSMELCDMFAMIGSWMTIDRTYRKNS